MREAVNFPGFGSQPIAREDIIEPQILAAKLVAEEGCQILVVVSAMYYILSIISETCITLDCKSLGKAWFVTKIQ